MLRTREDFIVSPTNAAAVGLVDAWPAWPGCALALVGPAGVGKSLLARLWAEEAGAAVFDARDPAILDQLAPQPPRPVLLEDADQGAPDELLFHLINRAALDGGGLLLTARTPPSAWPASLPDLRSRLNALSVASLPPPDDVILEGMLRNLFRERSFEPSDDLISYLLRRIERSAPYVQSLVERLGELAGAEHRPLTRALARQILEIDDETSDEAD